ASGGSYHCHPDHAYGDESDKSEESPSPKRQRLSSQSVLEQLTSAVPHHPPHLPLSAPGSQDPPVGDSLTPTRTTTKRDASPRSAQTQ
ncbi:hypothetical protein NQZ68_014131, partial [Dissostichus eleginoides]